MLRFLFIVSTILMPSMARAVTCDVIQYVSGDACTECPANATCDGVNYTCLDGFRDNGGLCAVCPAGQYLLNGECLECSVMAYCIGDDTSKACGDLWNRTLPLPQEYLDAGGLNAVNRVSANGGPIYGRLTDNTDPNSCICGFYENLYSGSQLRKDVHAPQRLWEGPCNIGPTKYIGVSYTDCDDGYYGRIQDELKRFKLYKECAPCNNATNDAKYTDYGTPDATGTRERSNCPWTCNDGYFLQFKENNDGTVEPNELNSVCRKSCSLGFRKLTVETPENSMNVQLYDEKWTSPSLHFEHPSGPSGICYADLEPEDPADPQTGVLKIAYNGNVYYTSSTLRTMDCTRANYYLTDGGSCGACGGKHYCPAGTNERISCQDVIDNSQKIYEQSIDPVRPIPYPRIYARDGNASGSTPESCKCQWDNLSDERRVTYMNIYNCYLGMQNQNTYVSPENCRVGYYAIKPINAGYYYKDCAPCTNGHANSHYTSYSTPSITGAVESNCPWECDDGYTRIGDECVAE